LPARSLGELVPAPGPAAKIRRATPDDGELIVEIKGRLHEQLRDCGPNTREPWMLRDWLDHEDHFAYLAEDGFLSYRWASGTDELEVEEVTASSAATARAFWQVLASHATMAGTVRACLAPADPVAWLTRDPAAQIRTTDAWMLRIVDAPAAVAGRGYPAAATVSAVLELSDEALPANSGRWTLQISGGEGRLRRAADQGPAAARPDPGNREAGRSDTARSDTARSDTARSDTGRPDTGDADSGGKVLRLGARGFAALYAGTPVATLRVAGLASGGSPAGDDALECAFKGPAYMLDYF
jgi:hypothetical protein